MTHARTRILPLHIMPSILGNYLKMDMGNSGGVFLLWIPAFAGMTAFAGIACPGRDPGTGFWGMCPLE